MKIAFVSPFLPGHKTRGVGFYGERLIVALKKLGVEVEKVSLSYNPLAYGGFDLVHFPYFDLTWPTLPPLRSYRTIVTVHDLIPLKFPGHFPFGLRGRTVWPIQKMLLSGVNAVLTDSQTSKDDIITLTNVNPKKISVTYLAADQAFKPLDLNRLDFVLYVGGTNWNKNVITLVRACQKIKRKLVLVGGEFDSIPSKHMENQPLKEILDLPCRQAGAARMTKEIEIRGYVETDELVKLYNQASVYVQPSIYEGFGLPVLEALSCGTPVICGRNSSLEEIGGDAVTYADVENVDDLAQKIRDSGRVQNDTKARMTHAAKFTWEKTAKETISVYEKVLQNS